MPSLIETVMNAVPADAAAKLAGLLSETPTATGSALASGAPALLAGAIQQGSTTAGASALFDQVKQATAAGNPLDQIGAVLSEGAARGVHISKGHALADQLLGGRSSAVTSALGAAAGVGGGSASTVLAFLAPLVLGALGRFLGPSGTVADLQALLSRERPAVTQALPSGLRSLFGPVAMGSAAVGAAPARSGLMRYLPWLLAAIIAVLLIMGLRTCTTKKQEAPVVPTPLPVVQAPAPVAPPRVTLSLPGGGSIDVAEGSIGYGVTKFLESSEPAPKTFVFDNLNFDSASNALTLESKPTIDALVAILKAYPTTQVRIVGYTDNQGDPAANKTLSDSRAAMVKQELVNGAIAVDRIQVAGMGETSPVADNATEDGRAKNRRTELVIVKK